MNGPTFTPDELRQAGYVPAESEDAEEAWPLPSKDWRG